MSIDIAIFKIVYRYIDIACINDSPNINITNIVILARISRA